MEGVYAVLNERERTALETGAGPPKWKFDRAQSDRLQSMELGRTLGEGKFVKVKLAIDMETGQSYAVKILDKEKVSRCKIVNHIKREICTLKLIKHPNVVRLYEILASRKKIYIVLEFVTGGNLLDKIIEASNGELHENVARKYFQQLIDAVGYCHSRGVYHRDLKEYITIMAT
ncbi:CBL-interacting protein kinase 32-like [Cryptomeria japonica]|uniref:CBL-interacting protein kinase 32-like n=1 Tax=Cryptomeria japonica TaxID=3369 RepID=UPI0027DA0FFB|nr:CBL-interacting protein kinase 32-like [Cryptomeria japonica]